MAQLMQSPATVKAGIRPRLSQLPSACEESVSRMLITHGPGVVVVVIGSRMIPQALKSSVLHAATAASREPLSQL